MSKSLSAVVLGSALGLAACGGTVNRTAPERIAESPAKMAPALNRMATNRALTNVVDKNQKTHTKNPNAQLDARTAQMCEAIDAELVKDLDSGVNLCIVEAAAPASLIGAKAGEIGAAAVKAAKIATKGWLESQPNDWPALGSFECTAEQGALPPTCEAINPPTDPNWNTCKITEYNPKANTTVTAVCKGATR